MRRAKWGIGAVVVVGAAWLLSRFFNGGGLGTGDGTNVALPSKDTAPAARLDEDRDAPPQDEPETATVATQGEEKSIGEGGVVEALIDGRNFFLKRGSGDAEWVPAEPDVIAGYARQAPGDQSGVKVVVRRKGSSLPSAEQELTESLRAAGVTGTEIVWPDQFIE
jgi:hypothetical protein